MKCKFMTLCKLLIIKWLNIELKKYHVKGFKLLAYLHGKQLAYSNILALYLFILHFQLSFCRQNLDFMNIHEYANKLI